VTAGELTRRVDIKYQAKAQNSYGEEVIVWTTLATVWASVKYGKGDEFFAASQENAEIDVVFGIRYRAKLDTSMRVYLGTRAFDILYMDNTKDANTSIYLYCKEVI
jgi:SPP1 family predicted phage head-tail adaptor